MSSSTCTWLPPWVHTLFRFIAAKPLPLSDDDKNLIARAYGFAEAVHHGQARRDSGAPYVRHVERVAENTVKWVSDSGFEFAEVAGKMVAAALLHDTIEDTATSYDDVVHSFGAEVADLVWALTSDGGEIARVGKTAYLVAKVPAMTPLARYIKLCDRLDNISDYCDSPDQDRALRYAEQTIALCAAVDEEFAPALTAACEHYARRIAFGVKDSDDD